MKPETVKSVLLAWLDRPCLDQITTKCDFTCPLWDVCEDLCDIAEKLEEVLYSMVPYEWIIRNSFDNYVNRVMSISKKNKWKKNRRGNK